jgi:hypothetical protein
MAALIVVVIAVAVDSADSKYKINDYLGAFILLTPFVMFLLPGGVLPALEWISKYLFAVPITLVNNHAGPGPQAANDFAYLLGALSYILLFVIIRASVVSNKRNTFRLLFLVFVSMVIIDAGGCLVHPPG